MSHPEPTQRVAELFKEFLAANDVVLNPSGPLDPALEKHLRAAFYAGMSQMMQAICAGAIDPDRDRGIRVLHQMDSELRSFALIMLMAAKARLTDELQRKGWLTLAKSMRLDQGGLDHD